MNQKVVPVIDLLKTGHQISKEDKSAIIDTLTMLSRQLEIEAALEKVRTRAMAMQNSGELAELVLTVFKELTQLDLSLTRCAISIMDAGASAWTEWRAEIDKSAESYYVKYSGFPYHVALVEAWKERKPRWTYELRGSEMQSLTKYLVTKSGYQRVREQVKEIMPGTPAIILSHSFSNFGFIRADTLNPVSVENIEILYRFGKVFDMCYTRFNDLKQAEAQAREAQIESALEKVRSRTMAMMRSDELSETAYVLFQQFKELNEAPDRLFIGVVNEEERMIEFWITGWGGSQLNQKFKGSIDEPVVFNKAYQAWKKQQKSLALEISTADLTRYLDYLKDIGFPVEETSYGIVLTNSFAIFSKGYIGVVNTGFAPADTLQLLERFAGVFDLTYTRFLDLQKAEAQAREATIEAALEKVRSRSLAMHVSDELKDVVAILFRKLKELGLAFDGGAAIHLFKQGSKDAVILVASPELDSPIVTNLPYDEEGFVNNPIINDVWRAKETGANIFNKHYSFEEKNRYFNYLFKHNDYTVVPEEVRHFILQAQSYDATFVAEKNSLLGANSWTGQQFSEQDFDILIRFSRVFEQAYIRFLDLQKAEAQAREAAIEAALEKVRSRSLGMYQSNELQGVVQIVFKKLDELGFSLSFVSINTFDDVLKETSSWVADAEQVYPICFKVSYYATNSPCWTDILDAREKGMDFLVKAYSREVKNAYWECLYTQTDFKYAPDEGKKYVLESECYAYSVGIAKNSFIMVSNFTEKLVSEEQREILKRFSRVFEQAYIRFLDLQKAEVSAKEAVRRASLDRVRAETASMRTTTDLERITPLIWSELTTLGVPFIRCGVFIMDEVHQQIHTFLSTPDGQAIASFNIPYDTPRTSAQVLAHWRKKELYKDHWDGAAFTEWTKSLVEQGAIPSSVKDLTDYSVSNLYLHFLPFLQGMLYVGSDVVLNDDELQLVQTLADAFSTAYARYEDFNRLEHAKQQIEKTLSDLKSTQAQLVQSEKMASLGELTAGIAHEIQNPLNFVNNFSEVNKELIQELKSQKAKVKSERDEQLEDELLDDISENEQKINHHGKRADAIVKGMLQHSRASTGKKELTDINALADEYLRLSYHGLRAKDKDFNADYKTDFDKSIGKIEVVPQDIGRVLLNLFNNAFYAASLPSKGGFNNPTVWVSTKKEDGKIVIRVRDNGPGISEKIVDKIFQPFFTTKPTGQGTGLGLSLSYDIIKAHGGALKVETIEGEGPEFIIILPIPTLL